MKHYINTAKKGDGTQAFGVTVESQEEAVEAALTMIKEIMIAELAKRGNGAMVQLRVADTYISITQPHHHL